MEKSRKMRALKKRAGRKAVKGFTLIELMIVIAIIAILASIAIPQYMRYQEKAKVSSYALPVARGCAMDIVSYCIEHPGQNVNTNDLENCETPVTTAGGNVTLNFPNTISCNANGSIATEDIIVNATLGTITSYRAFCEYANNTVRCYVK